jgi:Rad3-related DNA helicase
VFLPKPYELGAPYRYKSWRPGQDEALSRGLTSSKRIIVYALPVGIGKSLAYMCHLLVRNARAAILTSSRGLQTQLHGDFHDTGLVDVRGMGNYTCRALADGWVFPDESSAYFDHHPQGDPMCDLGPCLDGKACPYRGSRIPSDDPTPQDYSEGCLYFDAVAEAARAQVVSSNYAFWFTRRLSRQQSLGQRDILVLDEAHGAADELASFLQIDIRTWEVESVAGTKWPKGETEMEGWRVWASGALDKVLSMDAPVSLRRRRERRELILKLGRLKTSGGGEWIAERYERGWKFEPLWPGPYVENWLFQGIDKVILSSATIRPKALEYLGLLPESYQFIEAPSPFPVERRPIIHIPTLKMHHANTEDQLIAFWVSTIDAIIKGRQDRKGIVHTVSYERAKFLYKHSRFQEYLILHEPGGTASAVSRFKDATAPKILVSPAIDTGYDFLYDAAEYNIIGKVAFPDTRSPIMRARAAVDKDYPKYIAATKLVQASGRTTRATDDASETFILDDQIQWFVRRHADFFPRSWMEAYRQEPMIPPPPPKL